MSRAGDSGASGKRTLIWALPGVVLLALGGSFAWFTYDGYHGSIERAFRELESRNRIAAAQVGGLLRGVDQMLDIVVLEQGESLPERQSGYDALLASRKDHFPELRAVAVTDADGRVVHTSNPALAGFDASGRDYFRVHLAGPLKQERYVSRPFEMKLGGTGIVFSAAIRDRSGKFRGIALAGADPKYFESILNLVRPEADGTVATLFDHRGNVIYRVPNPEKFRAVSIANAPMFKEHIAAGAAMTRHIGVSAADGLKRIYSTSRLGDSGLSVSVAHRFDEVLAKWQADAILRLAIFFVTTLVTVYLARFAWQRQIERDRMLQALNESTEELRRQDERLRHLAFHDVLTGLPNRTLFQERLGHAIERSRRHGSRMSVTFVDLDGFKGVNDTLGHDAGDLLLREVAERICARMRRGADTVARLGGDEFVILMEDLKENEHCACLAEEIIADISRPVELRGRSVRVGASMGMAFYPEDGADAGELMKRADMAMYAAKLAGKGTYRFFSADMLDSLKPAG